MQPATVHVASSAPIVASLPPSPPPFVISRAPTRIRRQGRQGCTYIHTYIHTYLLESAICGESAGQPRSLAWQTYCLRIGWGLRPAHARDKSGTNQTPPACISQARQRSTLSSSPRTIPPSHITFTTPAWMRMLPVFRCAYRGGFLFSPILPSPSLSLSPPPLNPCARPRHTHTNRGKSRESAIQRYCSCWCSAFYFHSPPPPLSHACC